MIVLIGASAATHAGSKHLVVALVDYSDDEMGKKSFKALRASGHEDACWERFVEIQGIRTAYIENVPKSISRERLLDALHGSLPAAKELAGVARSEGLDGILAYVPDASGRYATVHGLSNSSASITASASLLKPARGLIAPAAFSKALCDAMRSVD